MSVSDLILFPHIPVEIYNQYKETNKVSAHNLKTIIYELDRIFNLSKSGNRLAELILFDFYLSINHISVYKDNITGKRLEQRLSKLFALSTGDEIKTTNPSIDVLMSKEHISKFDKSILDLVCSNYRLKGDLFFYQPSQLNIYKLSIKSLVPTNDEINFGAFEFASTIKSIDGLDKIQSVQERDRPIEFVENSIEFKGIGLGSTAQLKKLVEYIKYKNRYDEYILNFEILLRSVYKDDFMVYIKDSNEYMIYLISNESFINFMMDKVKNNFKNVRVEGNAIRVSNVASFIKNSEYFIKQKITISIPHFNEIEKLLINLSHDKSLAIRSFISSS